MWREDGCKYWDFCIQTKLCWGYPRFLVTRSLVLFVYFVDRCLSFFLLRFTDSDYLFGILDLRILITSLVSSNSSYFCKNWQKGFAFLSLAEIIEIKVSKLNRKFCERKNHKREVFKMYWNRKQYSRLSGDHM